MKKALITIAGLAAVLIIAGCTSPTSNTTSSSSIATTQDLSAALNAHFAARYTLVDNFTRVSAANETPVYSGSFNDTNGTFHIVTIYLANNTSDAQGQFDTQKAAYVDIAAIPNATVNANTSTHWAVSTNDSSMSGWLVQAKTAGPFGLSLDSAYVFVSQDVKPPEMTSETAVAATESVNLS